MKPGAISLVAVLLLVGAASHAAAGRRLRGTAAPKLSHRPAPRSENARARLNLAAPIVMTAEEFTVRRSGRILSGRILRGASGAQRRRIPQAPP